MADISPLHPSSDPEDPPAAADDSPRAPLLRQDTPHADLRRASAAAVVGCSTLLAFAMITALLLADRDASPSAASSESEDSALAAAAAATPSRGAAQGVSEKKFRPPGGLGAARPYPWSNDLLSWQRTGFHFQPERNWMNDPNGPVFYKGWYHFFYQYNPVAAVWGNIVWGHAASRDLVNWLHLPLAMVADRWFDANGVWTGSATLLPDGRLVMLYTGSTADAVQVQNLALPADPADPLLVRWVKHPDDPVLLPPPGIGYKDFRDPTTAWLNPDRRTWRIAIGSKINRTGIVLLYDTEDFRSYRPAGGLLHAVAGTGMWECVDFYPVSTTADSGLDTSAGGSGVKHVLKASLDDDKNDYYALGRYFPGNGSWVADDPDLDVGIGLRYDYGKFYASKTFYDQRKNRRVLWGWIMETDSEFADIKKGWASLQAIPRTVLLDRKTGRNLIQWPVEEVESLRTRSRDSRDVDLRPGTAVPVDAGEAMQLDITVEFEIDGDAPAAVEGGYSCGGSGGAAQRGALGPFGVVVLSDEALSEKTPVYFYVARSGAGDLETFFCADGSRSSRAGDVDKQIYGGSVPVLKGEKLSARILVDHSIVESFAQGGRTCITSRVYPTEVVAGRPRVFLFNNATGTGVRASLKVWEMGSATMRSYTPKMPL